MSKFGMAVVTARLFRGNNGTQLDKNGKHSMILTCSAGTIPNRNVLAGTVAEAQGFEENKTYLVQVQERPDTGYGPAYSFNILKELGAMEIVDCEAKLGKGNVLEVLTGRPAGSPGATTEEADLENHSTKAAMKKTAKA